MNCTQPIYVETINKKVVLSNNPFPLFKKIGCSYYSNIVSVIKYLSVTKIINIELRTMSKFI